MKKATEEKDCLTDLRMSNDLPGKEEIGSDRARHGFINAETSAHEKYLKIKGKPASGASLQH